MKHGNTHMKLVDLDSYERGWFGACGRRLAFVAVSQFAWHVANLIERNQFNENVNVESVFRQGSKFCLLLSLRKFPRWWLLNERFAKSNTRFHLS